MVYQDMIDGLGDIVQDHGDGPEMDDYAHTLYMVMRGKHYDEPQARQVVKRVAQQMRDTAFKLEQMADEV